MLKINFFLNGLDIGGTCKTAQLFGKYLNKKKYQISTITYEDADLSRIDQFNKFGDIILIDRKYPNIHLIQECDILHAFQSGYNEFPRPGIHIKVPHFVITNVFGFYDRNSKIDKDLFMSEWLLNDTANKLGYRPSRFDYIYNPVENPNSSEVNDLASKWKSEGAIILGRSGRPDSGIYHAINVKAAHLLRIQGYDIRFLVVAPPVNMVKDLIDLNIPFSSIDPTIDPVAISKFYNSIDIFAHARADGESGGLAIQEAMMHGKPIVSHIAEPSIPGMGVWQAQTEIIDNGINGFCVPNSPAAYAEALKTIIDDEELRLKMGENARQKAMALYHVDVCVAKLERIYDEIIS